MDRIADLADPDRCQGVSAKGQCQMVASDGSNFCTMHGGSRAKVGQVARYRAERWKQSIEHHVSGTNWQSLQQEIGVLRMLLEEHLQTCKTQTDLILSAGPIADLATKIEKLVASCNKLEMNLNLHLSKDQLIEVASGIVEIAAKYIQPEHFDSFGTEIGELITE